MATQVQSLFGLTPDVLQSQRNAALNDQAFQFAQMTPMQQAQMGLFRAGSQLGTGLAGLMGYQDPEEMRLKDINDIGSKIQWDKPESIMQAAQEMSTKGYSREAMALMQKAQEAQLGAAQVGKETALRDKAVQEATDKKAEAAAKQMGLQGRAQFLISRVEGLTPEMAMGLAGDEQIVRELLKQPDVKTEIVDTEQGQLLINSQTGATIANIGRKPQKPSMGSEIASGLAPLVGAIVSERAKKAGGAEGTEVGKAVAQIGTGYKTLDALQGASDILSRGIYAGGYGPLQEMGAKYGMGVLGDRQRLVNTQEYRSYIKQVVMPMMAMLGGSDSNEELKKMEEMMAADTALDPKAMQNIITNAMKAVRKDIARIEKQQKAVEGGTPLPTGPMEPANIPKPTKRFNRETGKFEIIGG